MTYIHRWITFIDELHSFRFINYIHVHSSDSIDWMWWMLSKEMQFIDEFIEFLKRCNSSMNPSIDSIHTHLIAYITLCKTLRCTHVAVHIYYIHLHLSIPCIHMHLLHSSTSIYYTHSHLSSSNRLRQSSKSIYSIHPHLICSIHHIQYTTFNTPHSIHHIQSITLNTLVHYGVPTIRRLLNIVGLFCRIFSLL